MMDKKDGLGKEQLFLKSVVIYFFLLLFDAFLVIFCAKQNKVNYVVLFDKDIFVGKSIYLFLGRNYVNAIIIVFFYLYNITVYKFFLKKRYTKKFLIGSLIFFVIFNCMLFYLFTVRVY